MKKTIFLLPVILFSADIAAHSRVEPGFFARVEKNHTDTIVSIGGEILKKHQETNIGFKIETGVIAGQVLDQFNNEQEYLSWETGFKFGYFSDVFIYGEAGVDFGELIFDDRDEDIHVRFSTDEEIVLDLNRQHHDRQNDIDGYLGIGAGINYGHITLEAFARIRQIDGEYWKAAHTGFTGVRMAVTF